MSTLSVLTALVTGTLTVASWDCPATLFCRIGRNSSGSSVLRERSTKKDVCWSLVFYTKSATNVFTAS